MFKLEARGGQPGTTPCVGIGGFGRRQASFQSGGSHRQVDKKIHSVGFLEWAGSRDAPTEEKQSRLTSDAQKAAK
jgi:hypothetical protein